MIGLFSLTGASVAWAEPGKNQIESQATCSDGGTYAFVLNGMGKSWHLDGSNDNLLVKAYTLTYYSPTTGDLIGSDTYGSGKKKGQKDDLITCQGETTTTLVGIGEVRVVAEFEAFVTPRGRE